MLEQISVMGVPAHPVESSIQTKLAFSMIFTQYLYTIRLYKHLHYTPVFHSNFSEWPSHSPSYKFTIPMKLVHTKSVLHQQ